MSDGRSGAAGVADVASLTRPADTADRISARLDELEDWLGRDIEGTQARALEVVQAADVSGDPELIRRARLVLADVWERKGELASAVPILWEVNQWAADHGRRLLLARSHLLLARLHGDLGDLASCLEHSVCSVELLDDRTPPHTRSFFITKLADALGNNGSVDAARERYRQAERYAIASGEPWRQVLVLNNLAYTEYQAREPELAWAVVEQMQAVAAASGVCLNTNHLDTIARILIALGRYAEAEQTALASIRDYDTLGYEELDAVPEYLLTLAVAQRCLGNIEHAQATLDRSRALCDARSLAEVRVRVQAEQAELFAAAGDYRRAFKVYKTFHEQYEDLRSRQREAQARTRQSMFETTEARQEAERFREQAYRDPLTGLRNRRYLDEHLPGLIADALAGNAPLALALADLDHFKRINDTLSHDVGDQVLTTVGNLLTAGLASVSESGFVARLGGEEFVIVLPGTDLADATRYLNHIRTVIGSYPWQTVTGRLPVTMSMGATATDTGDGHTRGSMLGTADRYLYAAKDAGRNRVMAGPHPTS